MFASQLSREQALECRDVIRSRHEYRLRELAWWIFETGGPIDALDGSNRSIDDLVAWAERFRGVDMPGLPAMPDLLLFLRWDMQYDARQEWDPPVASDDQFVRQVREHYLRESVEHYLLPVAQRQDPTATWELSPAVKRRVSDQHLHETGIVINGTWKWIQYSLNPVILRREGHAPPSVEFAARFGTTPPGPASSVLRPLLDRRPEEAPPVPRFQLPDSPMASELEPRFFGAPSSEALRRGLSAAGFWVDERDLLESDVIPGARLRHPSGALTAALGSDGTFVIVPHTDRPFTIGGAEAAMMRERLGIVSVPPQPGLLASHGLREAAVADPFEPQDMAFAYPVTPKLIDVPEKWRVLPVVALVDALDDLRIHAADGTITAEHLVDGADLARDDRVITATVSAGAKGPRAIWFETHDIQKAEWDEFHQRMSRLATFTRARFCTEAELFGED